jgi:protein SCO1
MRRTLFGRLAVLAALAIVAPRLIDAKTNRWGADYFPNPPVITQDGETLRFYDDLIKGRIVVVSFIYTSCADLCPITTARLAEVKDKLGDTVGRDVFFLSITVDAENDTPEKLAAFAEAYGAGPGWTFVTGKPEDIKAILAKLGDKSGERGLSSHRNEILLGNDSRGDWQRDSAMGEIDRLAMTIRAMDPKWIDEVRRPQDATASDTGYVLSGRPGQAMFTKLCAPCHTIGGGDRVGPDLRDVTRRRERAWLIEFMMNPARLLAQLDPIALAVAARFPAVRMPRLGLTDDDAADMIRYFEDEGLRSTAAAANGAADDDGRPMRP